MIKKIDVSLLSKTTQDPWVGSIPVLMISTKEGINSFIGRDFRKSAENEIKTYVYFGAKDFWNLVSFHNALELFEGPL